MSVRLGNPSWSLSQLGLQSSVDDAPSTINETNINHIANLAKIDLSYSHVGKEEIIADVNMILRCAKTLVRL